MAWNPISGTVPQYSKDGDELATGYYLKFYAAGTSTAINMATDNTGATLIAKCQLNSLGNPVTAGNAVFIPHINQDYKIALYPTSADADANTNGIWPSVDNLKAIGAENTSNIFYAENYSTLALAATAAAGKTLVITTAIASDSITLSGLTIDIKQGGYLNANTGETITINCPFKAGNYKIFNGAGSVAGTFGRAALN